jgi:hypothetical protein
LLDYLLLGNLDLDLAFGSLAHLLLFLFLLDFLRLQEAVVLLQALDEL